MPEREAGDHLRMAEELSRPGGGQSLSSLEVFLYALSNNLHEERHSRDQDSDDKWVVQTLMSTALRSSATLQQMAISEQPTAQALVGKLFGSAVRVRDLPVIEAMLDAGIDANHPVGFQDSLRSLCDIKEIGYYSTDFGQSSVTPLQHAIHCGDFSLAILLLNRGADVNKTVQFDDWSPLALATSLSRSFPADGMELVQTLLSKGAAINETRRKARSPLEIAAVLGNFDLVELFLESGAYMDSRWFRPLAKVRNLQVARRLLAALADRQPDNFYQKALVLAIGDGNDIIASLLMSYAIDLNYEDESGVSALSAAARQGRFNICAELIRRGARPNRLPSDKNRVKFPTTLQLAAYAGNVNVVQLLLDHGARVNDYSHSPMFERDIMGETALQAAILGANYDATVLLLNAGARVFGGEFTMAIRTRHQPLVSLLEPYFQPEEVDDFGASALERSLSVDDISLAHWILNRTRSYDSGALCEAVRIAVDTSDTSLLERLLSLRPYLHCEDDLEGTALGIAAWYRNQKLIEMMFGIGLTPKSCMTDRGAFSDLLEFRVKTRTWRFLCHLGCADRSTPLEVAVETNDAELVGLFLRRGYHPDRHAVLSAATRGSLNILKALIDAGADVNDRDPDEHTPLQSAATKRHAGIVQLLLLHGADVNAHPSPSRGRTALVAAIENDDFELVDILLRNNADVNGPAATRWGATALQMAAIRGSIGLVRKLLELGADYDAPSPAMGRTALEAAAEYGRIDVLQLLLTAGVSTEGSARRQYVRAVKFAMSGAHVAAAKLLKNVRQWNEEDMVLFQQDHICEIDLEDEADLVDEEGLEDEEDPEDEIFRFIQWPEEY